MIAVDARELRTIVIHLRDVRKNRTLCKQRAPLACGRLDQVTCPRCLTRRASQFIYSGGAR